MYTITGHHHISMITKNGQKNNTFYTKVLGLHRVLMTVNQDSPDMYHLFYGDETGAPGTELTFFEIPMAGMTHRGTNAITRIGLYVPSAESLTYWKKRFEEMNVKHEDISTYAGREALQFEDHEGLRMVLMNHEQQPLQENWQTWQQSEVPEEHQILGMATIELTVNKPMKTFQLLQAVFKYEIVEETEAYMRIQTKDGGRFSELLIVQQDGPTEKPGRGSIHHLALRAPDVKTLNEWDEAIRARGMMTSGEVDRHYFQSVYFRDGNGILFELATDEPGFGQSSNELGKHLELPPKLEVKREEIIANLAPLD